MLATSIRNIWMDGNTAIWDHKIPRPLMVCNHIQLECRDRVIYNLQKQKRIKDRAWIDKILNSIGTLEIVWIVLILLS